MMPDNAKAISELMMSFGKQVDAILIRVRDTESESEQRRIARMMSHVLVAMLTEVMNPIYEEYPDLRPQELQ